MSIIPKCLWIMAVLLLAEHFCGSGLPTISASMRDRIQEPQTQRALLIGIGDYQVLPDLPGANNDITLIRHILIDRFGFSPNNVEVLTDSAATRAGILQALNRLVKEAGENDLIYFHYSGHGSQVQDLNGDETDDQLDETIVPADGRTKGIADITDDELDKIFSRLKTPNAVLVFDSCHSGTVTRGVAIQTRSVPPDTRLTLYQNLVPQMRGMVPLQSQKYVLMTGAASNQPALDGPIHGNYHGFFTYALFQSLISTPLNVTPQVLFGKLQAELGELRNDLGRSFMPEPQLEAPQGRLHQPLFPIRSSEPQDLGEPEHKTQIPWFKVDSEGIRNPRLLGGGRVGGRGTVWALYPPNTKNFTPEKALAFGMTITRQGLDAIIRVEPQGVSIPNYSKAIVLAKPPGTGKVRVQFRDVSPHQKIQLEESLGQGLPQLEVVQSGEATQYVIDMKNGQIRVLSGDGLEDVAVFSKSQDEALPNQLTKFLTRSLYVNQLLALENPSTQIALNARIVQPANQFMESFRNATPLEDFKVYFRQEGEARSPLNSLQIELQPNVDCYVTIVDIDAEGTINVLFPNNYQKTTFYPDGFIKKGKPILIPDSLGKRNKAGFHWDFAAPAGADTIKIFATTDREIAQKIRDQLKSVNLKRLTATRGGGPASRSVIRGFRKLRGDLMGALTRGIVTVPDEELEKSLKNGAHDSAQTKLSPASKGVREFLALKGLAHDPTPDWTAISLGVRIQPR